MTIERNAFPRAKKIGIKLALMVVALVFIGAVGMNLFIAHKKNEFAKNMPEPIVLVTATDVIEQNWTPKLEAVGYIRPHQGAMLSVQMHGTVSQILVKAGDRVQKGQLLVALDSSVEQASLRAAEAQLSNAKANFQRFRKLVASNSASQAELDNAQATYHQLLANIESLNASIKRRQIYAPFDGEVGIVKINVGQFVSAGTDVVRVEDRRNMKVQFSLPQTELARVNVGQKVQMSVDALPGKYFDALITAIDPAVNKNTGLVELEASVESRERLYSGMFARLHILLPTLHHQVVVPQLAITYTMYGESAYVLVPLAESEKNTFREQGKNVEKMFRVKQVAVNTVDRQGIYAQLKSGVNIGDRIVTGGFQRLRHHALVEVSDKQSVGTTQPIYPTRL